MNNEKDYISLTDIVKAKDGDFSISDWLRNRNTLEYLGAWEAMFNTDFNYGEFATINQLIVISNIESLNDLHLLCASWRRFAETWNAGVL